jgi:aminopeptidase N
MILASLLSVLAALGPGLPAFGGGLAPGDLDGDLDGDWSLVRLDLDVTPLPDEGLMGVEGSVRVRLDGEASSTVVLAVNGRSRLVRFVRVDGPRGARVELNGSVSELPAMLVARIHLAEPAQRGDELELHFTCEADQEGAQLQLDPGIAFASWVEGWYPFVPDRKESLSAMLSAPGTTRFHLPPGWDVVSNGRLGGREGDDEEVVVTWEVDEPLARSFAAGPYRAVRHRVGEREVGVYLLPHTELDAGKQAELLGAALAAQEERFGPYPYATYAIAEVPEGNGFYASSEQGFIMARTSAFRWEHGNLPLWGHEMAHGWWGNLVASRGAGGILCTESLSQYSAVVAIEALEGHAAATEFLRFSRAGYSGTQCARGYFELARRGQDKPLSELASGGWQHDLSDAKGHWVYHMLRRRIGDELFFQGLRDLIERFAGTAMGLDDLRAHFVESAPPEAELETFFEQWLDRKGAPVLDVEWSPLDGERVEVRVRQAQAGPPYHLLLDLAVRGEAESRVHRVILREEQTVVVLEAPPAATDVVLDPEHRLLIWKPEYGERP